MTTPKGLRLVSESMREGARLDGSAAVLFGGPNFGSPRKLAGQLPPFLIAGFQLQKLTPVEPPTSTASKSQSTSNSLSVRDFERLSLAARAALGGKQSLNFFKRHLETIRAAPERMPLVELEDIEAAIAAAVQALDPIARRAPTPLSMSRGLQLVGCRIGSREPTRSLTLTNTRLPFSLSFIGCLFEGPLIADNCEVASLDLSGSALPGFQANGLRTVGDIYLRRTTVLSPIGLSGARVGGLFDGADMLAFPGNSLHRRQRIEADHGILNLSQAIVENELHLERARLWGGLSMRGATFQRQVHLTGAVFAAPIAVLEKWAYDLVSEFDTEDLRPSSDNAPLGRADADLAKSVLHSKDWPKAETDLDAQAAPPPPITSPPERAVSWPGEEEYTAALVALETLKGYTDWDSSTLSLMLAESVRARASAVRGDALSVRGSLDATFIQASGRLRLKYSEVKGAVRLAGSTLNSPDASRAEFDRLAGFRNQLNEEGQNAFRHLIKLRTNSGRAFETALGSDIYYPQDFCVDMRNSRMSDLEFGLGEQVEPALLFRRRQSGSPNFRRARLNGLLALDGVQVEGSITAGDTVWQWLPDGLKAADLDWNWGGAISKIEIEGALQRARQPAEAGEKREKAKASRPQASLGGCALRLAQSKIGDDVDLRGSIGLWGADLRDSAIDGRVLFSDKSGRPLQNKDGVVDDRIALTGRAERVCGELNLRGAVIAGDVHLIFDPDHGPDIRADLAKIGGRLDIYPTRISRSFGADHSAGDDAFWWSPCEHTSAASSPEGLRCRKCSAVLPSAFPRGRSLGTRDDSTRTSGLWRDLANALMRPIIAIVGGAAFEPPRLWYIDLRNASATVFSHPPAAWAHPEATSLEGFRYSRSSNLGPLPPIGARARDGNEEKRRRGALRIVGAGSAFVAIVWGGLTFWALVGSRPVAPPGASDTQLFAMLVAVGLTLIWCLLTKAGRRPRPLAIEYLERQRTEPNRFQYDHWAARYVPLEPFSVAAKALRDGGRVMSAEEVEYRRLIQQAHILSFRSQGALKLAMLILDRAAGYGFRTTRLAILTLLVILAVGIGSHQLVQYKILEPRPTACVATDKQHTCVVGPADVEYPTLSQVVTLMIPGTGDESWPWQPGPAANEISRGWLATAPGLLRLFGGFVATVFAFSVVARVETILARRN